MDMTMPVAPLSMRASRGARGEKPLSPTQGVDMAAPGLVRTVVPTIVGALLSFAAMHSVTVPEEYVELISLGLTGVLSGLYWLAVDALQSRWSLAGWLLGSTARPTYTGRHRKTSEDPTTATSDTSPDDRQ